MQLYGVTSDECSVMGSHSHARKRVRHQVSTVASSVAPSLLPDIPGSSVLISGPSQELVTRGHSVYPRGEPGNSGRLTINILPDDVLLEVFDIHVVNEHVYHDRWHALVHVCRRWRTVVFASTRHLKLQLRCTYRTPVKKMLDIWPALPITIENGGPKVKGASNIIAALKHPDRVRSIDLHDTPSSVLKRFAAAMKNPFPTLTGLTLFAKDNKAPVFPDSFLGESAPRLQTLALHGVPFPAMPKLLLSASDLVYLHLSVIPHSGYISPKAMVAGLSTLTRLKELFITFQSPRSRPGQLSPPRSTRAVLPALNSFVFKVTFISRSSINSYSILLDSARSSVVWRSSGHKVKRI
ncbi:hypothetical protein BC826DRAFT_83879 [Russula brevipes]|nr:hypothetical protein BC826DRAFT_83879 [Russula brevipes]